MKTRFVIILFFLLYSVVLTFAQEPVTNLVIQPAVFLGWTRPTNAESFKIYAGDSLGFQVSEASLIGSTVDTTFTVINAFGGFSQRFYTVVAIYNFAPNAPSSPTPTDAATNQSTSVDLSWTCSDPDGDPLTYDVNFGTSSTPPLVCVGQTALTFDPGLLANSTSYHWQIVVHDNHSHSTPGQVWSFTTMPIPTGMVLVPGGPYTMGSSVVGGDAVPEHTVSVPAFYMDIYEVTNAQYKAFCDATSRAYPTDPVYNGMPNYFTNLLYVNYPVVNVDWNDARAYATWAFKRLPTEAEWERAAKGNTDNRQWPWGDTWVAANANIGFDNADGYTYTSPVGNYPNGISPAGCYDMAGNVWEWCEDDYHPNYTGAPTNGSAWIDSPRGSYRIVRDGFWGSPPTSLQARCAFRSYTDPTTRGGVGGNLGFRCAKTL
jgi:formylglycine-generating enzyme